MLLVLRLALFCVNVKNMKINQKAAKLKHLVIIGFLKSKVRRLVKSIKKEDAGLELPHPEHFQDPQNLIREIQKAINELRVGKTEAAKNYLGSQIKLLEVVLGMTTNRVRAIHKKELEKMVCLLGYLN